MKFAEALYVVIMIYLIIDLIFFMLSLLLDKDLLPFQWCCVQSPLCNMYLAKRPLDRCQGYSWNSSDSSIPGNRGAPGIGKSSRSHQLPYV